MNTTIDVATLREGDTVGKLLILRLFSRTKGATANVRCFCGKEFALGRSRLAITRSCGCVQRKSEIRNQALRESNLASARHHGATATHRREFTAWNNMLLRCYNQSHPSYGKYGGRGITVCDRWKESFANFFSDMGTRPAGRSSVERVDNDKGYEPGNCKWAFPPEQSRNTSRNRNITFQGETLCRQDWANRVGVSRGTLEYRIRKWGIERALSTPVTGARNYGEHCRGVVLTEDLVREIRIRRKSGETIRAIAASIGAAIPTVKGAAAYQTWRHVTEVST